MKKILQFTAVFFILISCSEEESVHIQPIYPPDSTDISGPRKIDINKWLVWLQPDGRWGYDPSDADNDNNNAGGIFPKGTKHNSMYAGGLYVGTLKNGVPTVSQIEYLSEFVPGKILNTVPAPIDSLIASDPDSIGIGIISSLTSLDSVYWPIEYGAPVDALGHPLLVSDQDSWIVFNDLGVDTLIQGEPGTNRALGLEIERMTYMINSKILYAEDAFFIHFKITNKSIYHYSDAYLALWCDKDLGDTSDDLIGTDIARNMVFVYNNDPENGPNGPEYAIGYKLVYFSVGDTGAKLTSTNWYANGTDPNSDEDRYNLLKGLSQSGSVNEGIDPAYPGFVYSGDPVSETGVNDSMGGNGRIMLNVGPFTIASGKSYDFICVVIGGQGHSRNEAILNLRKKSDIAGLWFGVIRQSMNLE